MSITSIVRPASNAECVATLERLLEEAKRGEFQAVLVFRFGELPITCGHTVGGDIREHAAVFAIERWKHNLFEERNG
jgi:hypothetical protein